VKIEETNVFKVLGRNGKANVVVVVVDVVRIVSVLRNTRRFDFVNKKNIQRIMNTNKQG
jgi:hypothetical protein